MCRVLKLISSVTARTLYEQCRNQNKLIILTASQINQEGPIQVFVVHKCSMHSRAAGMVYTEVIHLRVATKEVTLLLVYHELLYQFVTFQNVQVKSSRWFTGPFERVEVIINLYNLSKQ